MVERIAVKRLTVSDLTFFETLFRTLNAGNQKAINLNADVFVEDLYPGLPSLVSTIGDVVPVSLTILGPSEAPPYKISRAITKREAYKNWRLNGEFVRDPEGEAGRFSSLAAGDLALMEFAGDPVPQHVTMLLLSAASDASIHSTLASLVPPTGRSMAQIDRAQVAAAAAVAASTHPIWSLAIEAGVGEALEDAVENGTQGLQTLQKFPARIVTAKALSEARAAAEENGRRGEALAWRHLQVSKATWPTSDWASKKNAVSPFDFVATDASGLEIMIDAKSTNGPFDRTFHMSVAELLVATTGRYDVWRVYDVGEEGAVMRVTENIGPFATKILASLSSIPNGVSVDSVSIDPSTLAWGTEVSLAFEEMEA